MKKNIVLTTLFIILISITNIQANEYDPLVKKIYRLYKSGDYIETIKTVNLLIGRVGDWGMAHYIKGRAYAKLQNFEKADTSYKKAVKSKVFPSSSFYEYAQILYSTNELEDARNFFKKSIDRNFETANCHYYLGDIEQILENYDQATIHYQKIIEMKKSDLELKQAAHFQIGKIYIEKAGKLKGKKQKKYVQKEVIPQLRKSLDTHKNSPLASEIRKEIKDVQKRFKLLYKDGRPMASKNLKIKFGQTIEYDTNITQTPDDTGSESAVDKSAPISKTDFSFKYIYNKSSSFVIKPEVKLTFDKYFSDSGEVYSNDSYSVGPSVRSEYKHTLKSKGATFNFDIEYNYFSKDFNQAKSIEYFSGTTTFVIGEKIKWFKIGNSSLKFKFKTFSAHSDSLGSSTITLNFTQFLKLTKKDLVLVIFNMDSTSANVKSNSTTSYMFRGDYLGPAIYKDIKFSSAFAITALDTGLQSETRGMELTINPSVTFTKPIWGKGSIAFKYNFTTKSSKQDDVYAYSKHVLGLIFNYSL